MDRRGFFRILGVGLAFVFGWLILSKRGQMPSEPQQRNDWERRLTFVCCDDLGSYSSGIYVRCGGGRHAFDDVRAAAPFMRWNDPGSSAAGLYAFLVKRFGFDAPTGGTISIDSPPEREADGSVDWKGFAGNQDLIVINVDEGSAKCVAGQMEGMEINGLQLGGVKIRKIDPGASPN
jgi:hypothetical protein